MRSWTASRTCGDKAGLGRHPAQLLRDLRLPHGVVLLPQLDRPVRDLVEEAPATDRSRGRRVRAVLTPTAAIRLATSSCGGEQRPCAWQGLRSCFGHCHAAGTPRPAFQTAPVAQHPLPTAHTRPSVRRGACQNPILRIAEEFKTCLTGSSTYATLDAKSISLRSRTLFDRREHDEGVTS